MSWLKKYRNIIDGWYNDAFPTEDIIKLSEERASICAGCPLNVNNACSSKKTGEVVETFLYKTKGETRVKGSIQKGCGCFLSKKLKAPNDQCPLAKW